MNLKANNTYIGSTYLLLIFFSVAVLMSYSINGWYSTPITLLLITSLGFQFFKKSSILLLIGIVPALFFNLLSFPRNANHGNLEVILLLALLVFFIHSYYLKKENQILNWLPSLFRLTIVTVYFFAGFNKLNEGFFDINSTCVLDINQPIFNIFTSSEALIQVLQISTILMELVVPFGLLFKRSRKFSVILLVGFHLYLSLVGFANFSALSYFLLLGSILSSENSSKIKFTWIKVYLAFSILAVLNTFILNKITSSTFYETVFFSGILYNIGVIYFFFSAIKAFEFKKPKTYVNSYVIVTMFLFFSWGILPYIGLSNTGNLTMFSNLITESDYENHLIVNLKKTKLFSFEEDYVIIESISDAYRWNHIENLEGYALPVIELGTQINLWNRTNNKPIPAVLVYKGKRLVIENLTTSTFSKTKWWHKYIYFRRIPIGENQECQW